MSRFLYSVWFLDTEAHHDDEDREWVACICIEAASEEKAKSWGDALARDRAQRLRQDAFLRSSIESGGELPGAPEWENLPSIKVGESATDEEIGW